MIVQDKINQFLWEQYTKKSESPQKKRKKTTSNDEITKLDNEIEKIKKKYEAEFWISDAANKMTKQLTFPTHHSKGVHPDSKGDNVNFRDQNTISHSFVGSHLISESILDATGNAAALPLAAFFNIVIDEEKNILLRDLLLEDSPLLKGAFADDEELSEQYKRQFQQALIGEIKQPITYGKNKQLLWPNSAQAIKNDDYTCIVPLYPAKLTNFIYNKIQTIHYSEENKTAKENRKKENVTQQSYTLLNNLAVIRLGGSNPQNVSILNSAQGGKHYLLPSLPPIFSSPYTSTTNTIFNNDLYWQCKPLFQDLFEVVLAEKNIYPERDKRKEAINQIAEVVLSIAELYQQRDAGWSKDYQHFNQDQKYWLDPKRADLEGEENFKTEFEKEDWQDQVAEQFAGWVNFHLQKRFPEIEQDFSTAEANEWRRVFKRILRRKG
ncbi:CRISPR-associated protein [Gallibacterium salpingitidis]|uniref:CRISPR-associated protein n=1 Tax=Gallibacterium salpingitidis TaxID=505341 RepID=A0AB36DZY6_9PAST|nr:type I-F CRISPR-associated protein Csy1 [Gallibacterium salpingitidis]OBX07443.1 CRISPR-associated protein [Gallibacterium salpingitidis]OBX09615.1 CRISPR-associated protein [Gallibacterium salpingitidis]WKT00850.1 type I-F CRISPR-associated protein Csy1 [Gallibacterium salpingitidis]